MIKWECAVCGRAMAHEQDYHTCKDNVKMTQLTEWQTDGFNSVVWFCLVKFSQTIGGVTLPATGILRMENGIIVNANEL